MQGYIVCEKKSNYPRIHVQICQHRCEDANTCEALRDFIDSYVPDDVVVASTAPELSAKEGLAAPSL
jgi:hypothetical protein